LPNVLRDLHRFGGVHPGLISLAPNALGATDTPTGVIAKTLGMGVVNLAPDAHAPLLASRSMRVRPERFFDLPSKFEPRRVGRKSRSTGSSFGLAPDSLDLDDDNRPLDALGIEAGQATGKGIRVAILDSGLWQGHPDFVHRAAPLVLRSFVEDDSSTDDTLGHGTFCAGILAGPTEPSEGPRYGVAPDVELYVGRVIGKDERAREFDVIRGISWALDNGCRIISISVGALPQSIPDGDYEGIAARALERGCLIVAAAGNDSARPGVKKPVRVPANSNQIIAVAAVNLKGFATNVSNAGRYPDNGGAIDLSAPGNEIYSSCAPAAIPYALEGGTSAATPFVAGVAAQHLERDSSLAPGEVWARLVQSARASDLGLAGTGPEDVGAGMVQALRTQ
jgi:subtilisin